MIDCSLAQSWTVRASLFTGFCILGFMELSSVHEHGLFLCAFKGIVQSKLMLLTIAYSY